MTLSGKTAIVVGGSQGIGESTARRLAADGAAVVVVASSSHAKAQAVVDQIASQGGTATAEVADVVDPAAVQAMVGRVAAAQGRIDILVNSAGVFYPTPVGSTPAAELDRMIDINLKGSFHTISAVAPHMRAGGGGTIVNISSCAGVMGLGGYSVYCATKAAIIMMTRTLAIELAPHGIRVNAIAPGNTETPMNLDIRTRPELAPFLDAMAARTPSGRTYSTPEDMAGLIAFLASDAARAMHGATVLMDEGFSAGL